MRNEQLEVGQLLHRKHERAVTDSNQQFLVMDANFLQGCQLTLLLGLRWQPQCLLQSSR